MERFDVRETATQFAARAAERAATKATTAARAATRVANSATAAARTVTAARAANIAKITAREARKAANAAALAASAAANAAANAAATAAAAEAAAARADAERADAERRNTISETISLNNGFDPFIHNDKKFEIKREIWEIILSHFDHETLLTCHFVCKNWKAMIQDKVWRRKAGLTVNENFSHHHNVPWQMYHWICKMNRNPFERNLLMNHSGEDEFEHWTICEGNWGVENPPMGVPELPVDEDPVFERRQFCFATRDGRKDQTVELLDAGIHPFIMDKFQPPIEVSEWYCGPEDSIMFEHTRSTDTHNMIFMFRREQGEGNENNWVKKTNRCVKYGSGLTRIYFVHFARSASEINCKMAGACIKVKFP